MIVRSAKVANKFFYNALQITRLPFKFSLPKQTQQDFITILITIRQSPFSPLSDISLKHPQWNTI